jgi:S-adenosylmethionine decarboxylase
VDKFEPIGFHVFGDFSKCENVELLEDEKYTRELLETAAILSNATPLEFSFHKFSPAGITATLILSESHISIHTYPEQGDVFLDIFTCGEHTDPEVGLFYIGEKLNPINKKIKKVIRDANNY